MGTSPDAAMSASQRIPTGCLDGVHSAGFALGLGPTSGVGFVLFKGP